MRVPNGSAALGFGLSALRRGRRWGHALTLVLGIDLRVLAVSACPRWASMLGVQRTKLSDFNALIFLDPIWSSPFEPPLS